ncbi:glycolate oxidase subunit GlcF [Steroidobacter agaridevorans]|uniref:glycolate oxidase subunit GlcF n=1 Tax=Steroidobacter agaridevorans TaxID=2695856 RepID=UPI00132C2F03|nr:glycolate oxidase subunit GlcF [Steroidobacter agaridevorans]GFE86087.1 glycolate oxidase iron-sulfur subunit [Steroidobacter agaridevorans]
MRTQLADFIKNTPEGKEAEEIVRRCVHCGFCTATCPTYQLLGDELDGPRGRIYLMKQVLEGVEPTRSTQLHLDRCLTCRACETTCPSGVQYGRLVDIGRDIVEKKIERPFGEQVARSALKHGLTSKLFGPAMRAGQAVRSFLPESIRSKVPERRDPGAWPQRSHARKMLLPLGCVQPSMSPGIDAATARVLDALEIEAITPAASCCGAIKHHLNDHDAALAEVRRNIDAWWPHVEAGVEAIVMNASGCGAMVKEYAHLLRHDRAYVEKAQRIVALTKDLAELLPQHAAVLTSKLRERAPERVVFHPPCTLQHGQKIRGVVEQLLSAFGAEVLPLSESHLCCGSAGTYSVLQPELSKQLRDRKLEALHASQPDVILSANIGCITHLANGAQVPVRHWIEWLDARLS